MLSISPYYSLELYISWVCLSLFPLLFTSLLFSAICKASSHSHFAFLHFFFLGMALVTASCTVLWTSVYSSLGTLSTRSNPLNLFITLHCIIRGFSGGSDGKESSCIVGGFFTKWAIREVQSQRRVISKNGQTTTQLHSFHMLAKYCSKFSKLGFSSMWTKGCETRTCRCSSWI